MSDGRTQTSLPASAPAEKETLSDRQSLFPLGFQDAYLAPTKYLYFEQLHNPARKTSIWKVVSRSSGDTLGHIAWRVPWRQYCFYPYADTTYSVDCLAAISDRVETCNRWQRNVRENLKTQAVA
jgi:hypothetical protein